MSSIEVTEHKAKPVVQPPDTYTISGLTLDHLRVIRELCGNVAGKGPLRECSAQLWDRLASVTGETGLCLSTYGDKPLHSIRIKEVAA